MDIIDATHVVNQAFHSMFNRPGQVYDNTESAFHDLLIGSLNDPKTRNVIIDPDTGEADLNWMTFLWWVYKGDTVRINDFLHGFFWSASGDDVLSKPIDPESRFSKMLADDPIVKAEHIKIKDYIKHINWVYHKTQNLPNITLIGRENVPERLHGLRQAEITVLDPKAKLPTKVLFPDYGQRKRYRTVDSYDIYDVLGTKDYKMIGTQNAVIIDDYRITLNEDQLKQKILSASTFLTVHGRCLFDIPMYDHGEHRMHSEVYRVIQPFIRPSEDDFDLLSMNDVNAIDDYVHDVVGGLNVSEFLRNNGYKFEIEELKLTDTGLSNSVAARVYLKLSPI